MDFRFLGLDSPIYKTLHHVLDSDDDSESKTPIGGPSRAYKRDARACKRDARAMAATPSDVKEYANSYVFVVDMPGLKPGDIKVQMEDENVLLVSGERKREEEKEKEKEGAARYVKRERRVGKFMQKFQLPENANIEKISAVCQDGVLTVTVEKLPPPEAKKPRTIEVTIA